MGLDLRTYVDYLNNRLSTLEAGMRNEGYKLERLRQADLDFGEPVDPAEVFPLVRDIMHKRLRVEDIPPVNITPSQFDMSAFSDLRNRFLIEGAHMAHAIVQPWFDKPPQYLAAGLGLAALHAGIRWTRYSFDKISLDVEKEIWERGAHYQRKACTMQVPRLPRMSALTTVAHEYGHHLVHVCVEEGKSRPDSCIDEGFCRSMERTVAGEIYRVERNPAVLLEPMDRTLGELKSAYRWVCEEKGRTPEQRLLEVQSSRDEEEEFWLRNRGRPTDHAIGNAVFYTSSESFVDAIFRKQKA